MVAAMSAMSTRRRTKESITIEASWLHNVINFYYNINGQVLEIVNTMKDLEYLWIQT